MQKTSIAPEILQSYLDSAANAGQKGQAQFFTPFALAQQLSVVLPEHRPVVCDLNCGNGRLLYGTLNLSTVDLLGCDIDPVHLHRPGELAEEQVNPKLSTHKAAADLTHFYPMMVELDWQGTLFALNPPWDLWWYRDRLADLADSELAAVREAFAQRDPRLAAGLIDSTIATLMVALDRMAHNGEGYLIANAATLQRLIYASGAPHAALQQHIWLRVRVPGNAMTGIEGNQFEEAMQTEVIYFARAHTAGWHQAGLSDLALMGDSLRMEYFAGVELRSWDRMDFTGTVLKWDALREEARARFQPERREYNLWLAPGEVVATSLNLFQRMSAKVDKGAAAQLHDLNGRTPMQLVLQRKERDLLLKHCGLNERTPWRVCPRLIAAVKAALAGYQAERAPLYPLPPIQRLGFLDEEDFITCRVGFTQPGKVVVKNNTQPHTFTFKEGGQYRVKSETVAVTYTGTRTNTVGLTDAIEFNASELTVYIEDEAGHKVMFLDDRIRKKESLDCGVIEDYLKRDATATLQQLVDHFIIPDVPDRATLQPEAYQAALRQLDELEAILS